MARSVLHRELMRDALAREADGQRALLAGDGEAARASLRAAADLYRESWEAAPSGSYGRLVGMLKASVLAGAGAGREAAQYALAALGDEDGGSPTVAYVRALSGLISGDDRAAGAWAPHMRSGSPAFDRTAEAIAALAARDQAAYVAALAEIVRDFEQRTEHLTGVAIADTALMLERLAGDRGLRAGVRSALLPGTPG
jgi:hypothetical protein